MTAKECIKGRRSIRKFKSEPVDHALLSEIIETASYSPSWKHTQITRYIAVEGDGNKKRRILDDFSVSLVSGCAFSSNLVF